MGTKRNPGAFDCYDKADPDEPMFVLLARDRHAALLVELWAILRARDNEPADVVAEAVACAGAIDAYGYKRRGRHVARGAIGERLLELATRGMDEHPEDYDGPCACDVCLSYAADDAG